MFTSMQQIQELTVDTPPLMHPIEEDDVDDKDPVPTVVNKRKVPQMTD